MNKKQKTSKILWPLLGLSTIAFGVVVFLFMNIASIGSGNLLSTNYVPKPKDKGVYNPITNTTTHSLTPGKMVQGFPDNLINTSEVTVQNSYHTSGKNYNQYTVNLTSPKSAKDLYEEYVSELSAYPYKVTSQKAYSTKTGSASIYAAQGDNLISMVMSKDLKDPSVSDMIVTYVVPTNVY